MPKSFMLQNLRTNHRPLFFLMAILITSMNCQKQLTPKNYFTEVINIEKPIPKGSSVQLRTSPGLTPLTTKIMGEKNVKIDPKSNLVIFIEKSSLTVSFKLIDAAKGQVLYALSCETRTEDDLSFAIGYGFDQIQAANKNTKNFGKAEMATVPRMTVKDLGPTKSPAKVDPLAPGSGNDDFGEETVEE